jgi:hypothetical protein
MQTRHASGRRAGLPRPNRPTAQRPAATNPADALHCRRQCVAVTASQCWLAGLTWRPTISTSIIRGAGRAFGAGV